SVSAILKQRRVGETQDAAPIVGTVNDALCFNPTTALVGVVTQGGHFPGDWRALLTTCAAKGLDVESALHQRLTAIPELVEAAALHKVELRDLRQPPDDVST